MKEIEEGMSKLTDLIASLEKCEGSDKPANKAQIKVTIFSMFPLAC